MSGELNRALVVGRRNSLRTTLQIAAATALLLPGFGVLMLPAMIANGEIQWRGLAWVALWTLPAFVIRSNQREHRVIGDELISTYRSGEVRRSLSEVVAVLAAPLMLPAARVQFFDGTTVWVYGPATEAFVEAILVCAVSTDNQLPSNDWLRPRRTVWRVLTFLVEAG